MTKKKKPDLKTKFLEKSLLEWNELWERVPEALQRKHPELRHQVGLGRVILGGRTMYIFRATEYGKGGIEKGLQRIRGPKQTGNASYGARMIRDHINDVSVEVLLVGTDVRAAFASRDLKIAMVKLHDPEWNRPHSRHMKKLRARRNS